MRCIQHVQWCLKQNCGWRRSQELGQPADPHFPTLRTKIAAASAWLPLLYDTVVMVLTTYKAFQTRALPGHFHSPILQTILAGGMIYYR